MGGGKKSAFAGQGKGWRKGVKGIGLKKKPTDGEPVKNKSRNKRQPQDAGREGPVKREPLDTTIFENSDASVFTQLSKHASDGAVRKEGGEDKSKGSGSDTETDSGVEDLSAQRQPRKPFEPGPPLGSNLELRQFPSDLESEGSADEIDEQTLEGRATVRRRGAREMGDLYRDECLAFCGELLALQRQWKQDFGSAAPGYYPSVKEPLIDDSREAPAPVAPAPAAPSDPPPYVALFKQFHARELPTGHAPRWQKSTDGNMFKRGESGKLVIRRKKLKKKRRHGERGGEARVGGGGEEEREAAEGVLVRRRKTRKDKGVAKTHGKYAKEREDGQEGETVMFLTPEEEDLAKLRRMIQNELAGSVETGPIDGATRSRAPWTEQEREAFKRSLFLFGLGRLQKVHRHMTAWCKKSQQQLGDISDACYVLLEQCLAHVEGSDLTSTQKRMQDLLKRKARGDEVETGPEVTARVGVFAKLPTNAKSWVRRLQLLDGLDHALHVCGSRTTQSDAFKIILLIAEDGTKPAPWWTRNADIALMLGVYRHGYANYDAVRLDPEFADAFAPALDAEGPTEKVRRKRRRKKQSDGDGEDIDGDADIDGGGLVADSFIESLVEGDLDFGGMEHQEGGAAEQSRFAPPLRPKLDNADSGEKRRLIDLDLNAPAEDSSPRAVGDPGSSEALPGAGAFAGAPGGHTSERGGQEGSPPEKSELDGGEEKGSGKKKRKGSKEEAEDEGEEKANPGGWPASVPLTLRLKRLISHLAKGLKKPVGIILQKEEAPAAQAAAKTAGRPTWSKKEKQDVVRVLTAFGLSETPGGKADWRQLLKSSGLPEKAESSALACFEELVAEATAVLRDNKALRKRQRKPIKHMWTCMCSHCKQKRLESLPPSQQKAQKREGQGELGPRTLLNVIAAKKLLDRIETLEVVRKALALIQGDWTNKELAFYRTADLPRWWRAGLHDREFSLGLIKHGIGNWAAIGSDPELAFPQPEDFKNEEGGANGLEALPPGEEAPAEPTAAATNGDREVDEAGEADRGQGDGDRGKEGSMEPPGGGWAFPGSKVLLRRLKYNVQILKRTVARLQKKSLQPTSGDSHPHTGKGLKRQGQESAVDGARRPAKRRRSNNDEDKVPAPAAILEPDPAVKEPLSQEAAISKDLQMAIEPKDTVAGHDRKAEQVQEDAGRVVTAV